MQVVYRFRCKQHDQRERERAGKSKGREGERKREEGPSSVPLLESTLSSCNNRSLFVRSAACCSPVVLDHRFLDYTSLRPTSGRTRAFPMQPTSTVSIKESASPSQGAVLAATRTSQRCQMIMINAFHAVTARGKARRWPAKIYRS